MMNELGISTAKGFHDKIPYAVQLKSKGWTTLCTDKTIQLGVKITDITLTLERGSTYLFSVLFGELSYWHTFILTVPDEGYGESTASVFRYIGGTDLLSVNLMLGYSDEGFGIYADDRAFASVPRNTTATIKYMKIISGV